MSWMFRWLEQLLAVLRRSDNTSSPAWVEPSNAITRAILGGAISDLKLSLPAREPAEVVDLPAHVATATAPAAPVTRTGQRTRRRRAGRAA